MGGRAAAAGVLSRTPLLGPIEDLLDRPGVPLQGIDDQALEQPLRPGLPLFVGHDQQVAQQRRQVEIDVALGAAERPEVHRPDPGKPD